MFPRSLEMGADKLLAHLLLPQGNRAIGYLLKEKSYREPYYAESRTSMSPQEFSSH